MAHQSGPMLALQAPALHGSSRATIQLGCASGVPVMADSKTRPGVLAPARPRRWRRRIRGMVGSVAGADLVTSLRQAGVSRGDLVALVISPALDLGLAAGDSSWAVPGVAAEVRRADEELRPRWVLWSGQTAVRLVAAGVRLATCWDIAAAH